MKSKVIWDYRKPTSLKFDDPIYGVEVDIGYIRVKTIELGSYNFPHRESSVPNKLVIKVSSINWCSKAECKMWVEWSEQEVDTTGYIVLITSVFILFYRVR